MFAFSLYVNPWGDFGKTGFHRLYNARLAKADFLDAMPRRDLPEVVVMGSSNTMQYRPATIERLTGKRAFNFGVFWGRAEDFLCITRHVVDDLDHKPSLMIIGIDTWSFAPAINEHPVFPGIRRRLLNAPQLSKHLHNAGWVKRQWANFIDSLSRQQLALSWKLFWDDRYSRTVAPPLESSEWFETDGTRVRYLSDGGNIFEAVEAGTYPISEEIRQAIAETTSEKSTYRFVDQFPMYDFADMDQGKIDYMTEMLEVCEREKIQVVFIINPVHPLLYQELIAHTRHPQNLKNLKTMLGQFAQRYSVVSGIFDASDVAKFGGDPEGFFDPMHPATRNCDLILERVAAEGHLN
ncbi:MAG: hypothetical protein DHS20C16_05410 [Phycisphaerae bacterium]|nr:MAG: hypothetical protein DHS20C16_05410 [Phycisphaerae bacterium]